MGQKPQLIQIQDSRGRTRQLMGRQPSPAEVQQVVRALSVGDNLMRGASSAAGAAAGRMSQHEKNPGGSCGCDGGMDASSVREIIRTEIRDALGDTNGGAISWGNRDEYMPGGRTGGEAGKGGVLASDSVEIPDGAAAGTEVIGAWSGTALARLTGEQLCSLTALFDTALLDYADHLSFEMLLNNDEIPALNEIPGDYIAKTATGEIQRYPLGGYKPPYDSVVGFRVRVVHDIPAEVDGGPGATSLRLRVEAGNSCPTPPK